MRRHVAVFLAATAILSFAPPARAVDMNPGDSCAGFAAGSYRPTGGPENPDGALVVCDGSIWQPILRYSSAGNAVMFASIGLAAAPLHVWGEAIIGSNGLSCTSPAIGAMRYSSASDLWEYCDGTSWVDLSAGSGTALAAGADRQIQFNSGGDIYASSVLVFSSVGRLGIGTANPGATLDVAGGVKIANDATSCSADKNGTIRYISGGDPPWEYCEGGAGTWTALTSIPNLVDVLAVGNDAGGVKITNLAAPTANADAATKAYVDASGSIGSCVDNDTTLCALETDRSSGDPDLIAGNIRDGVNVLGVTGNYVGCSLPPNNFGFTDISEALRSDLVYSNTVTMPEIGPGPVQISISGGGSPEYSINGATYTSASAYIETGDTLRLRLNSPATDFNVNTATVTIDGVSDDWVVRSGCTTLPAIGSACEGGTAIYAGSYNGNEYFTTAADQSTNAYWGTYGYTTGATSLSDGTGNQATVYADVVAGNGTYNPDDGDVPNAFVLCNDLALGGANWFVPALYEFDILAANSALLGINDTYWTSSESTGTYGRWMDHNGSGGTAYKSYTRDVRCVRRY